MLCFPNCKINIGLYITCRRADGYHNLETVFYPVGLQDVLEIVPSSHTQLHTTGNAIAGSVADNLVFKAYNILSQQYPDKVPALDIYLHKVIPTGAGLGGGSADGAFMLSLLNNYCQLDLSQPQLAQLALQLGSDCPFFIYNTPQLATGRGEVLTDIAIDLSAYSIQLILPKIHVATATAFKNIVPKPAVFNLSEITNLPIQEWRNMIGNDFEEPVFEQHPELANIKQQLYAQNAIYAAMSGSGSAIYGIFEKGKKAEIITEIPFETFYLA